MLRNPSFCFFALFLIVSLTPFINKPDSSSDLTIFMISSIYSVDILSAVVRGATSKEGLDPKLFVWIAASVADAVSVNPMVPKRF